MITVNIAIFFPFLVAGIIPFLYKRLSKLHIGWIVMAVPTILFICLSRYIPHIANGETYAYSLKWIPSFDINFNTYLDGLGIIFSLLITGIGALVVLYSIYYLSKEESLKHFYIYLLLFMGGMLGLVFSDHMIILYVFWE
ncbi:MAG TPA: Na+/H+ antiporter subunit A, partial [Bacillota bacterium]|nr:Na+/H+ antiporter subunit A [Bacillota bacterium]